MPDVESAHHRARALAEAGADVIVGSHAHVQLGSGWQEDTYVNYGLGNFVWYPTAHPTPACCGCGWWTARSPPTDGRPRRIGPLGGSAAVRSRARRGGARSPTGEARRGCAGLDSRPPDADPDERSRRRSSGSRRSYASGCAAAITPGCPVPWRGLRYLRLSHVGFDGRSHTGELVVAAAYARDVVGVFRTLYDARWPIRRMRLVDAYGGDDDRSMAADNTSGFNCRQVKGSSEWSDHAFGAAIDLNPVENPYVTGSSVAPAGLAPLRRARPGPGSSVPEGTIKADDVVVRAFAAIGWEWGGSWAEPDFQHFTGADERP